MNKKILTAVMLAMATVPSVSFAAPQVPSPIGTSGAVGTNGPVNLNLGAVRGPGANTFANVTGTAKFMSELRSQTATFNDFTTDSLDIQTTTGAGVAANNQAAFRFDIIGGKIAVNNVKPVDIAITEVGTGAGLATVPGVNVALTNAINASAGLLNAVKAININFAVTDLASKTAALGAVIPTNPNSVASDQAVVLAVQALYHADAAWGAATAIQKNQIDSKIFLTVGNVASGVPTAPDVVLSNATVPGFATVLQGGQLGATNVIFQIDMSKLVNPATGVVLPAIAGARTNLTQTDRVDLVIDGIQSTAVAGAPAKVDYEYYMYAGGNGAATAINNNRTASLAGATAVAITTAPGITSTLIPNQTAAVIDVAQLSKKFVPTTRQVLKGDAGLQIGSLGVAATSAAPGANVAITDGQNSVPNTANVGTGNNYPGTTGTGTAQYTGVSTNISRGVGGAYNNSVVGAIITQVIPGSPSIGDVTVAFNGLLDNSSITYNNALAGSNLDTVNLTITSVDPNGFAAFATANAKVALDMNKDGVVNGGDILATTVTANTATFTGLSIGIFNTANIPVLLKEDTGIVIVPTAFNASLQYVFGDQVNFVNPAPVASPFGSDVRNGSTRVADSVPASSNLSKTGFIRVTNRGKRAGRVTVQVFDNAGNVIVPAGTVLVPSLAPNVTYVIGGHGVGGAGKEIDALAGTPAAASFTGRARVVITGEFSNMDVQSLVQSAAGSAVQTNLSAHAGK